MPSSDSAVQVALAGLAQAERPDERVLLDGRRAEELRQRARAGVPVDLHLPEPLRGVQVALGHEEVVGVVGRDLGDPVLVAEDRRGRVQAGEAQGARGLGQRAGRDHGQQAARPPRRRRARG